MQAVILRGTDRGRGGRNEASPASLQMRDAAMMPRYSLLSDRNNAPPFLERVLPIYPRPRPGKGGCGSFLQQSPVSIGLG